MQRVEQYIESYTRRCSNRYDDEVAAMLGEPFQPWLTPEHARSVAVIAAEEEKHRIVAEACDLLAMRFHMSHERIEQLRDQLLRV